MSMLEMLRYFKISNKKIGKKIYIIDDSLFRECWETLKTKPKLASINKEQQETNSNIYIIKNKENNKIIRYIEIKT